MKKQAKMTKHFLAAAVVFGTLGWASTAPSGPSAGSPVAQGPQAAVELMLRCFPSVSARRLGEPSPECAVLLMTNLRPPREWDPSLPLPPRIAVCGVGLVGGVPPLPPLPVPWARWRHLLVEVL